MIEFVIGRTPAHDGRPATAGLAFVVAEPVGERALELYTAAMGVCDRAGVLDAFLAAEDQSDHERERAFGRAALKLAGEPSALAVCRATLIGCKVDGAVLTPDVFTAMFTRPGHYLTPYVAALMTWLRAGFFGAPSTSAAVPPPATPPPPTGAG